MAKDAAIILSGGMDSITMLYEYKDIISLAITFDYGSNHNKREIEYAALHCERLGIRHVVIPLEFMHKYFKSSLLEGADAIPEWHCRKQWLNSCAYCQSWRRPHHLSRLSTSIH